MERGQDQFLCQFLPGQWPSLQLSETTRGRSVSLIALGRMAGTVVNLGINRVLICLSNVAMEGNVSMVLGNVDMVGNVSLVVMLTWSWYVMVP